jgi:hypothetical protein
MAGDKFNHPYLHNVEFYVHVGRSMQFSGLENAVNIGGKLTRIGGQFVLLGDTQHAIQKGHDTPNTTGGVAATVWGSG